MVQEFPYVWLNEVIPHLFKQALFVWLVIHRKSIPQLLEEPALFAREFGRNLDVDMHDQIAAAAPLHFRYASAADTKLRSVLRAFGNLQKMRAFERRDADF